MSKEKRPVPPKVSPEEVALSILRAWGPFTVGLFTQQLVNKWSMTPKTVERHKTAFSPLLCATFRENGLQLAKTTTVGYETYPHTFRRWWKFQMRRGGVIDDVSLEHMMG
jgi:hypothetical protein